MLDSRCCQIGTAAAGRLLKLSKYHSELVKVCHWKSSERGTLCEAAVGRLGNEALPHELLAVGMSHSMTLVPLNHPDGQV